MYIVYKVKVCTKTVTDKGRGFETFFRRVVSLGKDTFIPRKVLVILVIHRKRWLRPDMTEKLLTGTFSTNTNCQVNLFICYLHYFKSRCDTDSCCPFSNHGASQVMKCPVLSLTVYTTVMGNATLRALLQFHTFFRFTVAVCIL